MNRRICKVLIVLISLIVVISVVSAQGGRGGRGQPNNLEFDDSVIQVVLDISEYTTFGNALSDQIDAGDGAGIDNTFRNSGVVIDEENGLYYGVNGVHPVNNGDYTSYYPKSIVAASIETDEIVEVYSFESVNNHDVDMEALTFAGDDTSVLYVGDEYNYIYELDLETGEITREWDLADIGVETAADRGIEALTYSQDTGYFYAGIQDSGEILVIDLDLEAESTGVELIDTWDAGTSPSGLFAHPDGQHQQ
ncbi:MAG: esterase-like activity of phytase family protein [Chloroflexota bacterium]